MRLLQFLGRCIFWLAWPVFYVYFAHSERTRILMIHNDQILVMKNWLGDGKWSLPGGGLHKGEPATEGALRELYEETGIQLQSTALQELGTERYESRGIHFRFYAYVARLNDDVQLRRQRIEVAKMCWMNPKALTAKNAGPDVLACLAMYTSATPQGAATSRPSF
jgi:8-oxo-dGTP pyrophosphatase MutT (NUDIX family)